ncbi:uncharacterized protein LTR77_010934 [Saxophila tyrrhenica]|uniref:FAD dependent oxidoreductase domain-containing protein n=1 Tax=Saxophila tyrrhenica TaxID=1690608 RepID=A0AAV9NUN6_9PEZI|nr:hypothetical protein LTR77_010934 [Saxophila tyrrhenica]
MASNPCDVGVLGAGVVGLTSALCLSRKGYRVRVVAKHLPGDKTLDWASPWAGAVILPASTEDERDVRMQKVAFNEFGALAKQGSETGVQAVQATEYWDDRQTVDRPWYADHLPGFRSLDKHELAPGTLCGNTFRALAVDPDVYLPWLMAQLQTRYGVEFVQREVTGLEQARGLLKCRIVVNASGNGARALACDREAIPIRGQTMLVHAGGCSTANRAFSEIRVRRGREYTYVIPRIAAPDTAIIGGIEQPGDLTTTVDQELRKDILRRTNEMTGGALRNVDLVRDVVRDVVGFRPGRASGFRIEREGKVVHAYGFGGTGYRYSYGAAEEVMRLVEVVTDCKPRL